MSLPFLCFSELRGLEHPPACSPFLMVQGGCPRMCYTPSGLTLCPQPLKLITVLRLSSLLAGACGHSAGGIPESFPRY